MDKVKHRFTPCTSPFGRTVHEILVDGAGCEWVKDAKGKWECKPKPGGDCDRKEWIDDGCRYTVSIYMPEGSNNTYIIYRCVCQNSIEDLLYAAR